MEDDLQNETSQGTIINIQISCDAVKNKNKKSVIIKNACSSICALLNSRRGGNLKLSSSQSLVPNLLDKLVRGIEQTLNEFLVLTSLREFYRVETKGCGREIIFSIKPSDYIITIKYNLFLPLNFLVKVLKTEPVVKVAHLLEPGQLINSNLQEYVREFQKDVPVPGELRESDTVQFKKIKSERNTNKTLADRIIANKITHYVSAFANHKGGHVYVGIDDENYEVCGESVDDKEKKRILEKVGSAINAMLWPVEHGKPERGKHWDISFIPVLDSNREEIPGLFIIVISIACCPGGVFVSLPESYIIENTKVVRMDFEQWKKKVLHDAHMRDIVKFYREKETKALSMLNPGDKSISEAELSDSSKGDSQLTHPIECETIPRTMSRIVPRNCKSRTQCLKVIDFMENYIEDGDFAKVQQFASEVCLKIQQPDIEVAVHFNLALAAYREWKFEEAYEELSKASNLISATENAAELEIKKFHLLACFRRGQGQYERCCEVTECGLQKIEFISPGRHSAWMLSDAGYLFSILAEGERNEEVRLSLRQQAIKRCIQAIEHTAKFDEDSSKQSRKHDTAKFNLLHRCHLRLAMLFLDCAPVAAVDDATHIVTDEDLRRATNNVREVENSHVNGDPLTQVNKCYLCLVRSDLSYRRSQKNVEEWERHHKEAVEWATDARELAIKYNFLGILTYADGRLERLSKVRCYSRAAEENPIEKLLDELELDSYQD